jgi:integrase
LHASVGATSGKTSANRLLQVVRAVFNYALRCEVWSGQNPAIGIDPFPEQSRERFLGPDELPKFFKALSNEENTDLRDLVLLAIFTGARRSNLLAMRWDEVDTERGLWSVSAAKTKNREALVLPLVNEATKVLKDRSRRVNGKETQWVFPSATSSSGHLEDPKRSWTQFRKRVRIAHVHLHDLRRTLGSWQAGAGVAMQTIAKSLGHADMSTTSKVYARLDIAPIRAAVELATGAMLVAGKLPKAAARKLLGAPRA